MASWLEGLISAQMPRFLQFLREFWPMPLPLMIHSALALFAQRTRIPTSARSIGSCVIWVCISSSSSSPECTSVKHCVIGMHHVKSLDASVSVLHHGYGAWSGHNGSFQLVGCPHLPDVTSPMKYRHEVNRPECTPEKHCVIGMHHVKSLDASVSVLHHSYGAWSGHSGSFQLVGCPIASYDYDGRPMC